MPSFSSQKINSPSSFGDCLKEKRKEMGFSLKDISEKINIREKYLFYLEENEFSKLLPEVYLKGFIKKYADFLNLDLDEIFNLYKKERNLISFKKPKSSKKFFFIITPNLIFKIVLFLVVLSIFSYLFFQFFNFILPPFLQIENPKSKKITISSETLKISGKTSPNAKLFIDEKECFLKKDGSFEKEIELEKGLNTITIFARNKIGKERKEILDVIFE